MENADDLMPLLGELLQSQRLAVLGTHDAGQPYCSLVAFAATDDLRQLVFGTTRSTRKYANIEADGRVALLVDSRNNEEDDFHDAVAATAVGNAGEVTGPEKARYLELYIAKHPYLRDFVESPTCSLLCVAVTTYYVVQRFQEVTELHMRP